jgi:PAT family acetyl-CoA transporter-like MFS transporter 1
MGSVCQSVGQYIGFFISFPVMIAMNSPEFSINYLGATGQLLSINQFFRYSGFLIILLSFYVQFCFSEDPPDSAASITLKTIISQMFQVVQFSHMKDLILLLLTVRLGLMAFDSVYLLQLSEHGLDEMEIGALSMFLIPIEIGVTLTIGWYLSNHFSLAGYRLGYKIRIYANLFSLMLLYHLPTVQHLTWSWYLLVIFGCLVNAIGSNMMFSVITSLFFRISQKSLGGTYMTFLATVLNFGGMFPNTLALWSVDLLSSKGTCMDTGEVCGKECISGCIGKVNGFYPLAGLSTLFALVYFNFFLKRTTVQFDSLSVEDWHYVEKKE